MISWLKHHIPTHESIEANRFLRPVAHRILVPSLWRFNRRSVPRGVALGVLAGILFPFAHMALAAVLALPLRANVPIAVGTTLINNPVTFLPLLAAGVRVGNWVLQVDRQIPGAPIATNVHAHVGWLHWLAQGSAAAIVGLTIIAISMSIISYFATGLIWRFRIARKWRRRHDKAGI
jgi:uncharacterized protein (DUF2062 family)